MKSYSWASLVTSLFILGSYFYETIVENQCLSPSHSWIHTPLPSSHIGHALLYALLFSYQPINHRLYYEWTPSCIIPHLRPHMISIALRWDVRFLSLGHQNPLRLSHSHWLHPDSFSSPLALDATVTILCVSQVPNHASQFSIRGNCPCVFAF